MHRQLHEWNGAFLKEQSEISEKFNSPGKMSMLDYIFNYLCLVTEMYASRCFSFILAPT